MSHQTAALAPVPSPDPAIPVAYLMDRWLSGRKATTLRTYQQSLADFGSFLGMPSGAACRAILSRTQGAANALAMEYRDHLQDRGLAPATVNLRLAALRSLVRLARILGLVSWTLEVEGPKSQPLRDTRGPGLDGTRALLRVVQERGDAKGARDTAIVRCLFDLALRRGELVSLDLEHLDLEAGTVSILGKGRRERQLLTLPAPTRAALESWLDHRGREPGPLFPSFDRAGKGSGRIDPGTVNHILRVAGKRAGLSRRVRPHGLRHAAITAALDAGLPLRDAQRYARHADPRTTALYDDNRQDLAGRAASLVAAGLDG